LKRRDILRVVAREDGVGAIPNGDSLFKEQMVSLGCTVANPALKAVAGRLLSGPAPGTRRASLNDDRAEHSSATGPEFGGAVTDRLRRQESW